MDLSAGFRLKREKSKDEPWFPIKAVKLIHWERKQESEGEVGPEIRERWLIWQEAGLENGPLWQGLNSPECNLEG